MENLVCAVLTNKMVKNETENYCSYVVEHLLVVGGRETEAGT